MLKAMFADASAEERQEAVNAAQFLLELDACKKFGLVKSGPDINFDRCVELLKIGQEFGVTPSISRGGK